MLQGQLLQAIINSDIPNIFWHNSTIKHILKGFYKGWNCTLWFNILITFLWKWCDTFTFYSTGCEVFKPTQIIITVQCNTMCCDPSAGMNTCIYQKKNHLINNQTIFSISWSFQIIKHFLFPKDFQLISFHSQQDTVTEHLSMHEKKLIKRGKIKTVEASLQKYCK